jgi:hypothetical protein
MVKLSTQYAIAVWAEHEALRLTGGDTGTHMLKVQNISLKITVHGKNGEEIVIRGQDVINQGSIRRFLEEQGILEKDIDTLAYVAPEQAAKYAKSLRLKRSGNYQYINRNQDVGWLNEVALRGMIRYFLDAMLVNHSFLSSWVESQVWRQKTAREWARDLAMAIRHGIKDPERAEEFLEQSFTKYLQLLSERDFPPYEVVPLLPPGVAHPLELPEEEGDNDE